VFIARLPRNGRPALPRGRRAGRVQRLGGSLVERAGRPVEHHLALAQRDDAVGEFPRQVDLVQAAKHRGAAFAGLVAQ
jgi:hypothetical protein